MPTPADRKKKTRRTASADPPPAGLPAPGGACPNCEGTGVAQVSDFAGATREEGCEDCAGTGRTSIGLPAPPPTPEPGSSPDALPADAVDRKKEGQEQDASGTPVASVCPSATEYALLPLSSINRSGHNPRTRFDEEELEALAQSMAARGLLEPILVCKGRGRKYSLIAGERRLRAAQKLGWQTIPALIRGQTYMTEARLLQLVENLQRASLSPIEEANAYTELVSAGLAQTEIARQVGRSQGHVANAIRLLQLPESVQAQIERGEVSGRAGRALLAFPPEECEALAAVVADPLSRMTVADLEAKARKEGRVRERREARGERRQPEQEPELAGAKGGASAPPAEEDDGPLSELSPVASRLSPPLPRPTHEEYLTRRAAELAAIQSRREQRAGEALALQQEIERYTDNVPVRYDPFAAALIARALLVTVPERVLEPVLAAQGAAAVGPLLQVVNGEGEPVPEAAWDELAHLSLDHVLAVLRDALIAAELAQYEETAQEPQAVRWYVREAMA